MNPMRQRIADAASEILQTLLRGKDQAKAISAGALQGATLNFGDELVARLVTEMAKAGGKSVNFDEARAEAEKALSDAQQNAPLSAIAGSIAGSVPYALFAPTRPIATAAVLGALQGAGAGKDDGERLLGAAGGAALGGALGGAFKAAEGFFRPPTIKGAEKAVKEFQKIAGDLPDKITGPLMYSGKGATNLAEKIATRPNSGSERISEAVQENIENLAPSLREEIGGTFPLTNIAQKQEELIKDAYERAFENYKAAYDAAPVVDDEEINRALAVLDRAGKLKGAVEKSKISAALRDVPFDENKLGTRELDLLTRNIRDLAEKEEGLGAFGGKTKSDVGSSLDALAGKIRSRLADVNPDFGKATSEFADDVGVKNAFDFGKDANLLGKNYQNIQLEFAKLPPNAKQAARLGLGVQFDTAISKNPRSALTQFNSDQFKQAVRPFFDKEGDFSNFVDGISQRAKEMAANRQIVQGSPTARRLMQQQQDAAEDGAAVQIFTDLARGGSGIGATINAGKNLLGKSAAASRSAADELLAEVLTRPISKNDASEQLLKKLLATSQKYQRSPFLPLQRVGAQSALLTEGE